MKSAKRVCNINDMKIRSVVLKHKESINVTTNAVKSANKA
jgi:ribosomal protein L28